jgi:phosphatidylinositol alpha-1,6-mannosyltransferase
MQRQGGPRRLGPKSLPNMTRNINVVMLLTDAFGGVGGIAKFNRDLLGALDRCLLVGRVKALPRLISLPIEEALPESVIYDRAAARGRPAFAARLGANILQEDRADLVICGHLHLLPAAWLLARVRGSRLALIIHGVEAWTPSRKILANWFAAKVDCVVAVSRYSADKFCGWSKLPRDQVTILPNCVELERFRPQPPDERLAARYGLQSSKVILTVGRLASQEGYKGFDQVIEVMPQLLKLFSTLKYLIVGDGDDRGRLAAKAEALGVSPNVVFTGTIAEEEKVAHYNLADAYVMPSTGEGFGIVLIEAAACGLPIIGSNADGSRDALLDGRLGQLVDPRDPRALASAISKVLEETPARSRPVLVDTFSVENFRARVAEWCHAQIEARVTQPQPSRVMPATARH